MAKLSHQISMTTTHIERLPGKSLRPSLANAMAEPCMLDTEFTCPEAVLAAVTIPDPVQQSFDSSGDTYSTFSWAGDALPDELTEDTITGPVTGDHELQDIQHIALLIAKRRRLDPDLFVCKIMEMCQNEDRLHKHAIGEAEKPLMSSFGSSNHDFMWTEQQRQNTSSPNLAVSPTQCPTPLKQQRRFSFDAGDDSDFGSLPADKATSIVHLPHSVQRVQSRVTTTTTFSSCLDLDVFAPKPVLPLTTPIPTVISTAPTMTMLTPEEPSTKSREEDSTSSHMSQPRGPARDSMTEPSSPCSNTSARPNALPSRHINHSGAHQEFKDATKPVQVLRPTTERKSSQTASSMAVAAARSASGSLALSLASVSDGPTSHTTKHARKASEQSLQCG